AKQRIISATMSALSDSPVRLRNPQHPRAPGESSYAEICSRPVSQDLVTFFKTQKTRRCLRDYFIEVQLVTDVQQLVEHRKSIIDRAESRRQRFSQNELLKVLDNAKLWSRGESAYSSGGWEDALEEKPAKKRWRNSLKAANTDRQLVKFLERRKVKSRQELLEREAELLSCVETKPRRFALAELKSLFWEFRQMPIPPARSSVGANPSTVNTAESAAQPELRLCRPEHQPNGRWNSMANRADGRDGRGVRPAVQTGEGGRRQRSRPAGRRRGEPERRPAQHRRGRQQAQRHHGRAAAVGGSCAGLVETSLTQIFVLES
ncbi:hypothetical protein BOX15_Mlig016461g1, partial [Macrostomum lignano]